MRIKLTVVLLAVLCTLAVTTAWAQTTWYPTGLYSGNFHAVKQCQSNSGAFYMAASDTGVYRTTDFINWTDVTAQFGGNRVNCFLSWTQTLQYYTIAGTSAGVYRTNDAGFTWTQASGAGRIPTNVAVYALFDPGGGRQLAGTDDGIYFSHTYDQAFAKLASPAVAEAYCFTTYMISGGTTVYVGTSNGVYTSPVGSYGASWSIMNNASTTGMAVRAISGGGSGLLAAVWNGETGLGLYTSPRSSAWVASNTGLGNLNVNAIGIATNYYAATEDGLYESTNGGVSWIDDSASLPSRVVKVVTNAVGSGLVAPEGGGVYRKSPPVLPPTPVSPANNATDVAVPTTLTWSYPAGTPTSYDVVYSTSPTFASGNVSVMGVTGTSTVLSNLGPTAHYYWRVRANFGAVATGYSSTFNFTTVGSAAAPTIPTAIAFSPAAPVTTDNITATASGSTDANVTDTITYEYEWAVSQNGGVTYGDWGFAGPTLDAANTTRGQMWKCQARATDGVLFSDWYQSPTVLTIANSAPTVPTDITFSPSSPSVLNDITATATGSTDVDGGALIYTYEWAVSKDGGATFGEWVYAGATLPAAATSFNDQWKCRARASDGDLFGPWYASPTYVTIVAAPPSAPTSVILSPAAPVTTDDLTAEASGSVDPSANPITYYYVWSVSTDDGGTWSAWGHPGATLSAGYTTHGEQWKCAVYAQSSGGASPWFYPADILTILNSAPSAPTSVTLNPTAPTTHDDLTATAAGSADADLDPLTYEYEWAVSTDGGANFGSWTAGSAVLPSSATAPSDVWQCRVRATDGTLTSAWTLSAPLAITVIPPPTLVSATYIDALHVDLRFSKAVDPTTSQQTSNYSVSPALTVSQAVRDADLQTVHLTTATQPAATTYTVTVSGVTDTLTTPIVAGSGDSQSWQSGPAPTLVSATYIDALHVDLLFNKAVDPTTSQLISNYAVSPALAISQAVRDADLQTVHLTTATQPAATTYTVTVSGVTDTLGTLIVAGSGDSQPWLSGPAPTLVSATYVDRTHVDLVFNQNVALATSQSAANYKVSPALTVSQAVRDADLKTVHLTTGTQTPATTYTATVTGVYSSLGILMIPGNGDSQPWTSASGPTVVSATYLDATHVDVLFSEAVGPATSQKATNYKVSPTLTVTQAVRDADLKTVHLTTSAQTGATTYTVTVSGVMNALGVPTVAGAGDSQPWTSAGPPTVVSATYVDRTHVDLVFSEAVGPNTSQRTASYKVSPTLAITQAVRDADLKTVHLTTGTQTPATIYTATVSGVTNYAGTAVVPGSGDSQPWTSAPRPTVVSATYIDATHVDVLFSEAVGPATSQKATNYKVSPTLTVSQAVRDADLKTIHLTTSSQTGATTYTVTVSGVMSALGIPMMAGTGDSQPWTSAGPPTVVSATYVDATHVDVLFSAAVGPNTSQRTANYAISPNLAVTQAVRDADLMTVHLTTGGQTFAAVYTVTVSGVMDYAGTAVVPGTGDSQSWTANGPLTVVSATYVDATHVDVRFNTAVGPNTSQRTANYAISPNLAVTQAVRDADLMTVHLTTSSQTGATTYTVTVSGVMDYAGTAVVPGTGDSQPWTSAGPPTVVSATYVDATHVDVLFSAAVGPNTSQRTANYAISPNLAVTQAVRDADLMTVHLTTGGQTLAADYTVTVSGVMDYAGTTVVPGSGDTASWQASPPAAPLALAPAAMVTAVAVPTQLGAQVAINLSSASDVTVSVRNVAGREIATLRPGKLTAGMHSLLWNGKSSLGTKVPSGTYLISVKATTADGSTCTAMSSLRR